MDDMANTPAEAIAKSKTITRGYVGLCLAFVRTCFDIPAKYGSAADAWKHAHEKHHTTSVKDIPAGAPVFFSTPATPYGHVALYLGGGLFRTNWSAKGTVVSHKFGSGPFAGMKMLGWTADLNGVAIPGLKGVGHASAGAPGKGKTIADMAAEVVAGKHGNGNAKRRKSLGVNAATYARVREQVNRIMRGK